MGLRERRIRHLNQVIEEHGFGEMILDKDSIFKFLEVLSEALEEMNTGPEKSLLIGVLIDQNVQSSIAPGILASRITSVVGVDVAELIPVVTKYTTEELVNRIDCFMDNFDL